MPVNTPRSSSRKPALLTALSLGALLVGCATVTPYQPLDNGQGYSDQRLESNRYRVRFAGNQQTPKETVQNYLLFRAAEITLRQGHDYFVAIDQQTDEDTTQYQTVSFGTGFGSWRWYPFGTVGVSTTRGNSQYMAEANILTFAGDKPAADPNAFDARQIVENLGPTVIRPESADKKSGALLFKDTDETTEQAAQ